MRKEILTVLFGLILGIIVFHVYKIQRRRKCCKLRDKYVAKGNEIMFQIFHDKGKNDSAYLKKMMKDDRILSRSYSKMETKQICGECLTLWKDIVEDLRIYDLQK